MKLMSIEMLKEKRRLSKNKKEQLSKRVEHSMVLELTEKLEEYLDTNDKVMLEVDQRYVGEFLNILSDKVLSMYDYSQIDKNKFIFYNKEIVL